MTLSEWLKNAEKLLNNANVATSRLDSLILLEVITNKDRSWLLAHPEFELNDMQVKSLKILVERRTKHEPLAYIREKTEFYGREFIVNNHTLEPRPETETMIELFIKLLKRSNFTQPKRLDEVQGSKEKRTSRTNGTVSEYRTQLTRQFAKSASMVASSASKQPGASFTVVDVGTGSGAIAITAKLLFPKLNVIGIDIDKKCIQTAKQNAKLNDVSIDFLHGNLLEPISDKKLSNWVILANLPYVPDSHTINEAAMFEPKQAIFGGNDGLDYYREMFEQIIKLKNKPSHVFTESLPPQHNPLSELASQNGYQQIEEDDFIQVFGLV